LWTLSIVLGAFFVLQGTMKFVPRSGWEARFHEFGYSDWLRYAVGLAELGGGALLWVPRAARFGAAGIAVVMFGAAYTHLRRGEFSNLAVTMVLAVLMGLIAWARRPRRD